MRRMINFTPVSYGEFSVSDECFYINNNPLKPGFYVMIVTDPTASITYTFTMTIKEGINTNYSNKVYVGNADNYLGYQQDIPDCVTTLNAFPEKSIIECIRLF